jgi:hypothetical protein
MTPDVARTLHSEAPFVAIEAAAGCGKTWTAATFASELSPRLDRGRVLLLSHTHAACGEFQRRCAGQSLRIDVDTCDSFALKVIGPYARVLGLPHPLDAHVGRTNPGVEFSMLATKAVELFRRAPTIARTIAGSYGTIILDEHQDSSVSQHQMITLLNEIGGSRIRAFGDPMQAVHPDGDAGYIDWPAVFENADAKVRLNEPRRWQDHRDLGDWITAVRATLKAGNPISFVDVPDAVRIQTHESLAGRHRFADPKTAGRLLHDHFSSEVGTAVALAFLSPMVRCLAQACGWRARINEGATLEHLDGLITVLEQHPDDCVALSHAFLDFLNAIGSGLTKPLRESIRERLGPVINSQQAGAVQQTWLRVFQPIYDRPDHRGLSAAMQLVKAEPPRGFRVRLKDHAWALRSLSRVDDPRTHLNALGRVRRRRTASRWTVSTIHKSKGLEFGRVLLCPVDSHQYPNGRLGARLLYVALSRASTAIDLVINQKAPSEHVRLS